MTNHECAQLARSPPHLAMMKRSTHLIRGLAGGIANSRRTCRYSSKR